MMTAEDVKKIGTGLFKYIRMADGSFRFIRIDNTMMPPEHSSVVQRGEEVIAGGTVMIKQGVYRIINYRSETLNVGTHARDESALRYILGVKHMEG